MIEKSVSFDCIADRYVNTRGIPIASIITLYNNLQNVLKNMSEFRVLDVGVGTGRFSIPLSDYVRDVIGVDISSQMLKILNEIDIEGKVLTCLSDATNMPFGENSFDMFILASVLHLIPQYEEMFNELERISKKNSYVVLLRVEYLGEEGELYEFFRHKAFYLSDDKIKDAGISFDDQISILKKRWRLVDKLCGKPWISAYSPNDIIKNFKNRVWSETWSLSDNELENSILKIKDHINKKNILFTEKKEYESVVVAYLFSIK